MKGLKCIKYLILSITCLLSLKLCLNDASALSLTPNNVNFNYNTTANGAFDWSFAKTIPGQGQPVGSESYITPVKNLRYMQFSYQPIGIDGNHAALHFEANVVYIKNSLQATMIWQYLSSQQITSCFSNSTYLNIENQALSYAQTSWDNGYRNTLTIYGDVTLSGLPSGSTGQSINCNFGNSSTPFFSSDLPSATSIYLEQNPTSIVFSNNLNDALLAQQIAQYEVQIQLQNQMNDKLDDLSSQSQQNTQDIIKSNQRCHQSVNKLNLPDGTFTSNGITWTRSNGSITGSGTLTDYTWSNTTSGNGYILNLPSGTYTFSIKNSVGSPLQVEFSTRDDDNNRYNVQIPRNGTSVTHTFSNGLKITNISIIRGVVNEEYNISISDIQIQEGSSATAYEPYGEEICQNYNEEISDFLHDNTPPSVDTSSINNSAGWLPPGPVDSILTLPVVFIQSILSAFNNDACRDVVLPLPYLENKTLTLPCMRPLLNQMGFLTIYEVVGSVISMFVIYNTLKWLYKFVDDTLTFREDNNFGGGI